MSDERLTELGIPRRRFLKRTAAAAFTAPVVVSFAFDGDAEARRRPHHLRQMLANQILPNQTMPYLTAAERDLAQLVDEIVGLVASGVLSFGQGDLMGQLALRAALQAADRRYRAALANIAGLIREIDSLPSSPARSTLLSLAQAAQAAIGPP